MGESRRRRPFCCGWNRSGDVFYGKPLEIIKTGSTAIKDFLRTGNLVGNYLLKYFLPGLVLIALGFYAGAQKNPTLGLFAFLCFFVMGVTLIVEGWRKKKP